jgi:hypothetical protein
MIFHKPDLVSTDLEYKKKHNPDVDGDQLVDTVIQLACSFFQVLLVILAITDKEELRGRKGEEGGYDLLFR